MADTTTPSVGEGNRVEERMYYDNWKMNNIHLAWLFWMFAVFDAALNAVVRDDWSWSGLAWLAIALVLCAIVLWVKVGPPLRRVDVKWNASNLHTAWAVWLTLSTIYAVKWVMIWEGWENFAIDVFFFVIWALGTWFFVRSPFKNKGA